MSEPIRLFSNYGGQTLTARDRKTLDEFTFGAIPMRLLHLKDQVILTVEVWENIDDFEAGKPTSSRFNHTFTLTPEDAHANYSQFFDPIEAAVFDWLGVSAGDYELDNFDINLTNLKISAKAVHKTNKGKTVFDSTDDLGEFEQIKTDYPQLVQAYFAFAWTYAKTHDARLALFN